MNEPTQRNTSAQGSANSIQWPRILIIGCAVVLLLGFFGHSTALDPAAQKPSGTSETSSASGQGGGAAVARIPQRRAPSQSTATAAEIVAGKVSQFARGRRELVQALADRAKVTVSAEVQRFFDAIEAGRWEEVEALFKSLRAKHQANPPYPDVDALWAPILETFGVAEQAHEWPPQKLLDYGNAVLGALRPGMVYVGGTDPGRFIPTLLNETSDGEHHVVVTQNGLADAIYRDYLAFQYGGQFQMFTQEDSEKAFSDYTSDALKRLNHDQQFPDEPKQIRPGEDVSEVDGKVQVSGQMAVMAINEKLLQTLMQKNPELSFGLEESFPLKSTYADAAPLGPISELRVQDGANALTAESAAQSVDYWRATAQQLLDDPEAAGSSDTLKTYSKMAVGQANLFADRNFPAEAEQAYRLASQIAPGNVEAATGLAALLNSTGRAAEGQKILADFARNYPEQSAALAQLRSSWTVTAARK